MKTYRYQNCLKNLRLYACTILLLLSVVSVPAQLCQNSADTIYGLNSITGSGSGQIIGINVNTAGSSVIGSAAASSANANGLGFSSFNGRFYFFNQTGGGTTEFVSYDPITSSKMTLASPPYIPAGQKMRSGTVTKDGTGYYTIFPDASTAVAFGSFPVTGPAFFYYNIALNTWTLITQSFKDISGNTVTPIQTLNSGDMAFDGSNNLWILSSKGSNYALYRIKTPVPTTAVASVTVDTIIAQKLTPTTNIGFTGIAFNSAGKLYLSTQSGAGAGYNTLYQLATVGSALTTIGVLTNGYGDDLTSCSYPLFVLPVSWVDFKASFQNKSVNISWKIVEDENTSGYDVESSTDGEHWNIIAHYDGGNPGNAAVEKTYNYTDKSYRPGTNYYRIVQHDLSGKTSISGIKQINTISAGKIYLGPNPAHDKLYIYNKENTAKYLAQVFDKSGRLLSSVILDQVQQTINISQLPKGSYILRLSSSSYTSTSESYQFIKW